MPGGESDRPPAPRDTGRAMSGRETRNSRADALVRYRVVTPGSAKVRMTVFEDGAVELRVGTDSRSRRYQSQIDQAEVDALRSALAAVPAARWSHPLRQARPSVAEFFRELNDGYIPPTQFQLTRKGRVIFGKRIDDDTLAPMLARLDALRIRVEAQAHG